jgi:hypothetical protein
MQKVLYTKVRLLTDNRWEQEIQFALKRHTGRHKENNGHMYNEDHHN